MCLKQFWHVHVIIDDLMKSLARHPTRLFASLIFMQIAFPDKIQTDSFVTTSKDIYSRHSMVLTSKAVDTSLLTFEVHSGESTQRQSGLYSYTSIWKIIPKITKSFKTSVFPKQLRWFKQYRRPFVLKSLFLMTIALFFFLQYFSHKHPFHKLMEYVQGGLNNQPAFHFFSKSRQGQSAWKIGCLVDGARRGHVQTPNAARFVYPSKDSIPHRFGLTLSVSSLPTEMFLFLIRISQFKNRY